MRQIKFRAFDSSNNKMVNDLTLFNTQTIFNRFHNEVHPTSLIIMQFTGLQDKNGVDIYEGDILSYYQPYAKRTDTHIVKWDDNLACFGLFEKNSEYCQESDWYKIQNIEIIGNIHENKEIIK